jgi:hypothetical protein
VGRLPPLERAWSGVHVRAPHADETFVAVPPLSGAIEIAHRNRDRLATAEADIQGRSLAVIRQWARREVLNAARDYTAGLIGAAGPEAHGAPQDPSLDRSEAATIYVGGHQPTLFHPGVWVKNFVVGRLAQNDWAQSDRAENNRAVGLNLVVDTDTLSGTAVRVPTGTREAPRVATVAFDATRPRQPWEEARIIDRELFASFPARIATALGDWGFSPLLAELWPAAVRCSTRSESLAECLTAARAAWEWSWGVANLELPVSRLCTLEPFLWFAGHLLAQLPRFRNVYNEVLREYRVTNRVRSRTHPVPDLREDDGWLEAPFRVWRAGAEVRRPVFARQFSGEIRLSDGDEVFATLPLDPGKEACCALKELQTLSARGIRLRTRALTTTMFARLCFADLFVHGIGGAKYDQMTDRIVARFFGLEAPEFLTMSATLQLPVPRLPAEPQDECRLRLQLRELDYNSDRHLPLELSAEERALVAEKRRLIVAQSAANAARKGPHARPQKSMRAAGSGYARFQRLKEINRRLAEFTQGARRRIEDELLRTRQQLAANSVLGDREYAFCLFPAEKLRRFMDHVSTSILE